LALNEKTDRDKERHMIMRIIRINDKDTIES